MTGDRPHQRLDRRVLTMWWVIGALLAVLATAAVSILATFLDLHMGLPLAVAVLTAAVAAGIPPLRYRRWSYRVRERDAMISKGALFFVQQLIPFDRIQFVESRQGPLDRLFGVTQVVLYTAAGRAARVPGLAGPEAESLREELSRVAGAASV